MREKAVSSLEMGGTAVMRKTRGQNHNCKINRENLIIKFSAFSNFYAITLSSAFSLGGYEVI